MQKSNTYTIRCDGALNATVYGLDDLRVAVTRLLAHPFRVLPGAVWALADGAGNVLASGTPEQVAAVARKL